MLLLRQGIRCWRRCRQELQREKELLVLPGMQRPYFMEYRLEDMHSYDAVANYGALTTEGENHQRVVRVEVRIGDYASDSSSARGDGSLALAPKDDDPAALQYALWTATDEAYKNALRAYAAKQAALKHFRTRPRRTTSPPAKPVTRIEPLLKLDVDRAEWKRRLAEASGLYATAPEVKSFAEDVQYSSASTECAGGEPLHREHRRHGAAAWILRVTADKITVGGQAADGMQLGRSNGSTADNGGRTGELGGAAAAHARRPEELR